MTKQKQQKKAIRARMEVTGEKYTVARRGILSNEKISTPPPWLEDISLAKIRADLVRFIGPYAQTDPILRQREEEAVFVERYLRTRYWPDLRWSAVGSLRLSSSAGPKRTAIEKLYDAISDPTTPDLSRYLTDPAFEGEGVWPGEGLLWYMERLYRKGQEKHSASETFVYDEETWPIERQGKYTLKTGFAIPIPVAGAKDWFSEPWPEIQPYIQQRADEFKEWRRQAMSSSDCPYCGHRVAVDDPTMDGEEVICQTCDKPSAFSIDVEGCFWLDPWDEYLAPVPEQILNVEQDGEIALHPNDYHLFRKWIQLTRYQKREAGFFEPETKAVEIQKGFMGTLVESGIRIRVTRETDCLPEETWNITDKFRVALPKHSV